MFLILFLTSIGIFLLGIITAATVQIALFNMSSKNDFPPDKTIGKAFMVMFGAAFVAIVGIVGGIASIVLKVFGYLQ